MLERYKQRMSDAIKHLGGKCQRCPAVDKLQLDHIDPKTKLFAVAKQWNVSEKRFWLEVDKCQLLCQPCHELKTLKDNNQVSAKNTHGTLSSYLYCKCALCRKAKADWTRQYRLTHKRTA